MSNLRTTWTAAALTLLLTTSFLMTLVTIPETVSAYDVRDPIIIFGDADFTAANGVRGGSGTAWDPYIIEGWEIDAPMYYGIQIANTTAHFTIRNCYIHGPGQVGIILFACVNGTVTGNTCSGNDFGIYVSSFNNIIPGNNTLSNNTCSNNNYGIALISSVHSTLSGNNCSLNVWGGIALWYSNSTSLGDNKCLGNNNGIHLGSSGNNTLSGNNCSSSKYNGIGLSSSGNNTVSGNDCLDNDHAIVLSSSSYNNTLSRNNCSSNNFGIWLESSNNNTLCDNNVSSNWEYGVYLSDCTGTTAYHNVFFDNAVDHAYDDRGSENFWNASYPFGGNYWDNYTGIDVFSGPNQDQPGPDGIGDTPYVIDANSTDYYPLMEPEPPNTPPTASFTVIPSAGDLSTVFEFDASSSWDYEDSSQILEVRWDFDGDGEWDTDWSTEKIVYHQYDLPSEYVVKLEVRDSLGLTNVTSIEVVVIEVIPEFSSLVTPILCLLLTITLVAWRRRNKE